MRLVRWLLVSGSVAIVFLGSPWPAPRGSKNPTPCPTPLRPAIASGVASAESAPVAPTAADAGDQAGSLAVDTAGLSPAAVGRQVVSTATVAVRADDMRRRNSKPPRPPTPRAASSTPNKVSTATIRRSP